MVPTEASIALVVAVAIVEKPVVVAIEQWIEQLVLLHRKHAIGCFIFTSLAHARTRVRCGGGGNPSSHTNAVVWWRWMDVIVA